MRAALILAFLLVARAPAAAHMVVVPAASDAGGWERYSLLVPTEKDSPTVRIELKLPMGMEVVAVEAKPGWQAVHDPFPVGAATARWTGGRIPPGQMMSFDFMAWNPRTPRTMTWVATQWYEDGTSDRWGEGGDPEHHASTTTLRPGSAESAPAAHGAHAHGPAQPAPAAEAHGGDAGASTGATAGSGPDVSGRRAAGGPSLALSVALSSLAFSIVALVVAMSARRGMGGRG